MSFPRFLTISKWWKLSFAAVFAILTWVYLWYFPWQARLHHIFWLQLGVGLAIFIVPGFCVYGLLSDSSKLDFNHITFGFVISHLILALLGTLGRFLHLSFDTVTFLMMVLGLVLILNYILSNINRGIHFHMDQERSAYFLAILPILLVALLTGLIVIQRVLNDDDLTYLAYITNWQHAAQLGFDDLIFGIPQLTPPRFWIMSVPFAEALLANVSRVPGILILGGYYEPFLVIISVLCWYELALALKLSPKAASASVILQLLFLLLLSEYTHPGAPYFSQLSVDKATAAYILAPVFFSSLVKLLANSTWKKLLLSLFSGLSLTFMHPIILAYSVAIAGLLVLLRKSYQGFGNKLKLLVVLVAIMMPQIVIRFVQVPAIQPASFDPEIMLNQSGSNNLVARWGNTRYYGFNPDILTMQFPYEEYIPLPEPILKWGWLLLPILATLFALKQWNTVTAQFILACFLLCFLAWFPLTGWILGYFLNARMLARSVWVFPYGISAVYFLVMIKNQFQGKSDTKSVPISISNRWLASITGLSLLLFFFYLRENHLPDFEQFSLKSIRYADLATAGQTLDQMIPEQAVVIGSSDLNDLIPGISPKSELITFRIQNPSNMAYFTSAEREMRISDTQKIFSRGTSADDQLSLLEKYNVHFLLLQRNDIKLFDDLMTEHPNRITATEVGGVYIVQIR